MAPPFLSPGITGELPWISSRHGGSALQGLGWSACVPKYPKNSSLQRAKLCIYLASSLHPGESKSAPYFEMPVPLSRLQLLTQFCMGSHLMPVEGDRLARPAIPRHVRLCICAVPKRSEMKGILWLVAPVLSTSAASFSHCTKTLTVEFCVA